MPLPSAETTIAAATSNDDQGREGHGGEVVDQSEVVCERIDDGHLAEDSMPTASTAPKRPTIIPSIMNGQRMNQLVAPTSRITSTSRRRA